MMKDNWRGFVIDGSKRNISRLEKSYYYWKYDLQAICAFVNKDNIEDLLDQSGFDHDLGILSIDLDGVDYFILSSIVRFKPRILICEFNPIFGPTRKVTVPYDEKFQRFEHHYSGQYWGASLPGINDVASRLGYGLIGTNSAGHNAFFIRDDLIRPPFHRIDPERAFNLPTYRDSRDKYDINCQIRNGTNSQSILLAPFLWQIKSGIPTRFGGFDKNPSSGVIE